MQSAARILLISWLIAGGPQLANAGTTVITHGFQAGSTMPPGWSFTMAEAILVADGDPSGCGSIGGETPIGTVFSYSPEFGTWDFECGSDNPLGPLDWGDRAPVTWTNIDFADNYWRADGGAFPAYFDFDGMPLPADLDLDLGDAIEGLGDLDPPFGALEHIEVHAWYHGTIDLTANNDGDGTQIDNESTDWYDNGPAGVPARDMTGFFYSSIVGGARPGPVSGVDPAWSPHSIYNGNFEIVDDAPDLGIGYAGWRFHGGDKPGIATPWSSLDPPAGSTYYLSLFAGANNESLTHNRLYVDESVGAIELTRRIAFSSANDRLQVLLSDGIVEETLADIDLSAATAWEIVSFDIPVQSVGRTQTLRFAIDGGGDGVEAVVDLDDVHFVPEPHGALLLAAGGAGLLVLARRCEARRGRDR